MVLILSDSTDASTCEVVDWLNHFKIRCFRINECTKVEILKIEFDKNALVTFLIKADGFEIDLTRVTAIWYRRGWLNISGHYPRQADFGDRELRTGIMEYLNEELENIINLIHQYLGDSIVSINSFLRSKNDKMYYLLKAAEAGLTIPDTIICTHKQTLKAFKVKHDKIITKSINEGFMFSTSENSYFASTEIVDDAKLQQAPDSFFPTLIQEYIDKQVELRSFYLHGEIYTMAIFSQQNEQTKVDFRHYDYQKPNRLVPFKLPVTVEEKIRRFMKAINLNSGSLDIILDKENNYSFLEVNPVGQFGMVSKPCNYHLEKKIAETLYNS